MSKIRGWELAIGLALVFVLVIILVPALLRSPRPHHAPWSCTNNLKQLNLVMLMYANESPGERYPPLSHVPNNWMMEASSVWPEYLTDPGVLACPSSDRHDGRAFQLHAVAEHPHHQVDDYATDCIWGMDYTYTGYALSTDAAVVEFLDIYREQGSGAIWDKELRLSFPRLTRRLADDADFAASLPIMWDRFSSADEHFNHLPGGSNVLYLDGHVAFVRFGDDRGRYQFPLTHIVGATFGRDDPALSPDCFPSDGE
jgi:prepilin-type processing-associated H-X9-DG protein